MNKNMRNKIVSIGSMTLGFLSLIASFIFVGTALAANPQFNNASDDLKTLVVGNWTTNGGTTNWGNSLSVNAGDRIAFDVYYHNTVEGTVATNTKIRLNYPTSKTTGFTATATIVADNASQITDTATINMSTAQTFDFEPSAKWYQNDQVLVFQNVSITKNGSNVEVNLGNVDNKTGHVVFYANVSKDETPPPVCTGSGCIHKPVTPYVSTYAGPNINLDEDQSITFQSWATDSNGGFMTYSWNCTGGTLSSTSNLRPTYYAPLVSNDTTYVCTLTVVNDYGSTASSSLKVFVRNGTNYSSSSVTTNNPENITTNSAVLKGTLINDGGLSSSMRFNWNKVSSGGNNNTYWVNGKFSGDIVSYVLNNLEPGKAYKYKVEATNSNGGTNGQDVVFSTKPQASTSLTAKTLSSSQISLSWNKGTGSCYTKILRKTGSYPAGIDDGIVAYYGYDSNFIDKSLASNTRYYYTAWGVSCDQGIVSYSDQYSQANAVTNYIPAIIPPVYPPVVVSQSGVILEFLARNKTQGENAWQDSISANPGDEIEFYAVITPTGTKNLTNVNLKSLLSENIGSISELQVNGSNYQGVVSNVNIGLAPLGQSTVVAFKGVVAAKDEFSYGKNVLSNSVEVSSDNVSAVTKSLDINVDRSIEAGAGLSDFLNNGLGLYAVILTLFVFILIVIVIYLIIVRNKR